MTTPAQVTEAHRSEARKLLEVLWGEIDIGWNCWGNDANPTLAQALADAERRGVERERDRWKLLMGAAAGTAIRSAP